jgi:hypothetical protein
MIAPEVRFQPSYGQMALPHVCFIEEYLQPDEYPTIVDTWKGMEKLLDSGRVPASLKLSAAAYKFRQGQVYRGIEFFSQNIEDDNRQLLRHSCCKSS